MKGHKPTAKDIRRTFYGILQSTAFLGCHAVGFSLLTCSFRYVDSSSVEFGVASIFFSLSKSAYFQTKSKQLITSLIPLQFFKFH